MERMGTGLNGYSLGNILQFPHTDKNIIKGMPISSVSHNGVRVRGNTMIAAPDGIS